jgi:antitoxin VapB
MNLQIRDPRAHELASELARKRNISMTNAVIAALETELQRSARPPVAERLNASRQRPCALPPPSFSLWRP